MVEYIKGVNGIGKSRVLAEAAVSTAQLSKGHIVYVDCTDKLTLALPRSIRLINASDYAVGSIGELSGFLMGVCAGDYDITDVFVDAAPELIGADKYEAQEFFEMISRASQATGVDFHFCIPDVSRSELEYSLVS